MAFLKQGLHHMPKRIVSLVPSQTELLADLGLEAETVGITKFCIHPEAWFRSKTRVGGTKTVAIEKVRSLAPDLIIANKEENVQEQVEALCDIAPVWMSDINDLDAALDMIRSIGHITGRAEQAGSIANEIESRFAALDQHISHTNTATLYLIWRQPWMSIGQDTFIHHIMHRAGLQNVCSALSRYPELSNEDIIRLDPALVLLSSEPYPFKEKHIAELQALLPNARILLADGEMFSWYGSRLLQTPLYLRTVLSSEY